VREKRYSGLFDDIITLRVASSSATLFWWCTFGLFSCKEATYTGLNFDDLLFVLNSVVHCSLYFRSDASFDIHVVPLIDFDVWLLSGIV